MSDASSSSGDEPPGRSKKDDINPDTAFAPLRLDQYRTLWSASLISNLGSFFQVTAGAWLMWELTSSPMWVGWMTASRNLPLLVLAIPAGALADKLDKTKMLAATQLSMGAVAAVMAALTWFDLIGPASLLALGLALGVGQAFNAPMWQSLVPDLVPRAMVTSAVALNSVSFNAARAIGPAIGGILVATVGAAAAFGLNAISYLFMVAAFILVGRGLANRNKDTTSVRRAMATGIRFAAHTPSFRRLLGLGTVFALTTAVLQAMLPVRTEELGSDAGAYGLLLGMMGAGAAVGGIALSRMNRRFGAKTIPNSIMLTGAAGILMGFAPNVIVAAVSMFAVGVFWVSTLANLNATVQLLSPDWVRGRAVGLWLMAYAGMVPVGAIISGLIAEQIGAGATMVVLSVATVMLGVTMRLRGVQDPTSVPSPEFSNDRTGHDHPEVDGGPVMIVNTWHIHDNNLAEFRDVMVDVRAVRLSTGGSRWQLYKDVGSPYTYSEAFVVATWNEHLLQHQRIDDDMASVFAMARRLDMSTTGPTSHHYLGFDVGADDVASWEGIGTGHDALHASDGSVPIE
jgi:MFS family permease